MIWKMRKEHLRASEERDPSGWPIIHWKERPKVGNWTFQENKSKCFQFLKTKMWGMNKEEIQIHLIWTFRCPTRILPFSSGALYWRMVGLAKKELGKHKAFLRVQADGENPLQGHICSALTHITRWEREAGICLWIHSRFLGSEVWECYGSEKCSSTHSASKQGHSHHFVPEVCLRKHFYT